MLDEINVDSNFTYINIDFQFDTTNMIYSNYQIHSMKQLYHTKLKFEQINNRCRFSLCKPSTDSLTMTLGHKYDVNGIISLISAHD